MSYRKLWATLGLSAMGIGLVALPCSSTQKQETNSAAGTQSQLARADEEKCSHSAATLAGKLQNLKDNALALVSERQIIRQFRDADEPVVTADDDLQFFMSTGGGWLGVGVTEVSPAKAKELKLPEEHGAILGHVVPESPAAKAGLKENDVVTQINGQRVEGTEQFRRMIHEIPAGRTASLTVWRDGRSQDVKVTIGKQEMSGMKGFSQAPKAFAFSMPALPALPDLSGMDDMRSFSLVSPGQPLLGIDVETLKGEFGNYFGAPDGEGVLVRGVFANSPAAKAGLKVGDVITSMNGERIRGASELREKLMTKRSEKTLELGILRNKTAMTVSVELPKHEENFEHLLSEHTHI